MDKKVCTKCKIEHSTIEFTLDSLRKDKLKPWCKTCCTCAGKERTEKLKKRFRQNIVRKSCSSCQTNKASSQFYKDLSKVDGVSSRCKDCTKSALKRWAENNPEKAKESCRTSKNRLRKLPHNRIKINAYTRNKKKVDLNFKISENLRSRLYHALKGKIKTGSAITNLGCTVAELKFHLESLFQEGMAWDNYGRDGWWIDHIVPLSAFGLTDPEQIKKACHYTNLQPLWAKDNMSKGGIYR